MESFAVGLELVEPLDQVDRQVIRPAYLELDARNRDAVPVGRVVELEYYSGHERLMTGRRTPASGCHA